MVKVCQAVSLRQTPLVTVAPKDRRFGRVIGGLRGHDPGAGATTRGIRLAGVPGGCHASEASRRACADRQPRGRGGAGRAAASSPRIR